MRQTQVGYRTVIKHTQEVLVLHLLVGQPTAAALLTRGQFVLPVGVAIAKGNA